MGVEQTISWANGGTFNPWVGCAKIKDECRDCYAEAMAKRFYKGRVSWGRDGARYIVKGWRDTVKQIARRAAKEGVRRQVFCGNVCDIGEAWTRPELRDLAIEALRLPITYAGLDFLYLTKRPHGLEELSRLAYADREDFDFPDNAWVGVTCGHPASYPAVDILRGIKAWRRFVSAEPLLAPLPDLNLRGIDWVIVGGESGKSAQPMDLAWAHGVYRDARECGAAFFFKQLGSVLAREYGLKDSAGGNIDEYPPHIRNMEMVVREYPRGVSK